MSEKMQVRRKSPETAGQYAIAPPSAQPENILEKIVWTKEQEVLSLRQQTIDLSQAPPVRDFLHALHTSPHHPALIAEVKKASPSKGILRRDFDPVAIARSYVQAGADCLSVLTDQVYFLGSFANLQLIRQAVSLPLLCKEFIIDPRQIHWARYHGADAILLIAAILHDQDLAELQAIAQSLGMTALVEVHSQEELERVLAIPHTQLIGINNRNLKTFTVDLHQTGKLLRSLSPEVLQHYTWVSESGIASQADIDYVRQYGVRAVLVGESLVTASDPQAVYHSWLGTTCRQ